MDMNEVSMILTWIKKARQMLSCLSIVAAVSISASANDALDVICWPGETLKGRTNLPGYYGVDGHAAMRITYGGEVAYFSIRPREESKYNVICSELDLIHKTLYSVAPGLSYDKLNELPGEIWRKVAPTICDSLKRISSTGRIDAIFSTEDKDKLSFGDPSPENIFNIPLNKQSITDILSMWKKITDGCSGYKLRDNISIGIDVWDYDIDWSSKDALSISSTKLFLSIVCKTPDIHNYTLAFEKFIEEENDRYVKNIKRAAITGSMVTTILYHFWGDNLKKHMPQDVQTACEKISPFYSYSIVAAGGALGGAAMSHAFESSDAKSGFSTPSGLYKFLKEKREKESKAAPVAQDDNSGWWCTIL